MDRDSMMALIVGMVVVGGMFALFVAFEGYSYSSGIPVPGAPGIPAPAAPSNTTSSHGTNGTYFYTIISSTFPGQPQSLTLPMNSSGYIMYPDWEFQFFSQAGNTSYQVYLNGGEVSSGFFMFHTAFSVNVTAASENVSIILTSANATEVFNWHNIPILHTTIGKYYSGQKIELPVFTVSQWIELGVREAIAIVLLVIASYFIVYKTYVLKHETEVEEI